ncbi:ARM repeat superfamily protein [Zea mays]|uniref:ARM repeat superfamily protein n=1 Tax=Zea mays TaxID=4577 RepID=A0A1D6E445_MAIZE|nr:ARM repeat superfamily protein [Zea mays]
MLPAVAAASPGLSHLPRYHHLGRRFHLRRHRLLPAIPARLSCGATHARRLLLAGAFAKGEGSSGQDVDHSAGATNSGSAYLGLFVRLLGLDNDTRDREHAVCTLYQYSLGGRKSIDEIMQFPGCIVLIISLLKSESILACEAATGLLRNITSVHIYRKMAGESGAMEEIINLLCKSTITPKILEQCLCTIWNFSIDEKWRYKVLKSDVLMKIVGYLDEEDIQVKEAAGGIISNLALSSSSHGALVEVGVIPKLVHLLQTKEDDYKIIRKEAKSSLIQLATDDCYYSLIIEEGLVRVPLVGSAAYKAFKPLPHSWPSFPDGSKIQRSSHPSKYGATELLLGLSVNENDTKPDEAKINAMIGRSNQQFLARVGAIELDDQGQEESGSEKNDMYTILPWVDGVARLVLILGLEDVSAIKKAARAMGDASINEHMRTSFKEAGAVKPLLQLLKHKDVHVREAGAYALEKLCVSATVCHNIKTEGGLELLVNIVKDRHTPVELLEKIIYILSRMFDMGICMVAVPDTEGYKDSENSAKTSVNQEMSSELIFDFDAISHLTEVLKEASPRLQAKVCCVLDHIAASEQHATAMTAACTGSVIEAILEIGVIHGTRSDSENFEIPSVVIKELSEAVSAAVRKKHATLVDTEVRRSARLREKDKGFKPCFGRKNNCLCCAGTSPPPSLSHRTIKELGVDFCNVDPQKLSLNSLNNSRSSSAAIQRPRPSSCSTNEPSSTPEDQRDAPDMDDDAESHPAAGL